jgi:hypothetical protein
MSHGVFVLLAGQTRKYLFGGFFYRSCPDETNEALILDSIQAKLLWCKDARPVTAFTM